jgi:hypothetical protein
MADIDRSRCNWSKLDLDRSHCNLHTFAPACNNSAAATTYTKHQRVIGIISNNLCIHKRNEQPIEILVVQVGRVMKSIAYRSASVWREGTMMNYASLHDFLISPQTVGRHQAAAGLFFHDVTHTEFHLIPFRSPEHFCEDGSLRSPVRRLERKIQLYIALQWQDSPSIFDLVTRAMLFHQLAPT